MTEKRGHFIAGRDVPASDGRTMRVVSPANDSVLAEVAQGTTDDVEAAVSAARAQLDGAGNNETGFLSALDEIVARGSCPAELKLDHFNGAWRGSVNPVFKDYAY